MSDDVGVTTEERARKLERKKRKKAKQKARKRERDLLAKLRAARVPVLKPREPTPYDGAVDAQAFHKFVQEMTDYVDGYQLEASRQAATVAHFLTGNAYRFYANTVALSPRTWSLRDVFTELFNYCFPADFRQQMKKKLRKAHQGDKTVKEYILVGAKSVRTPNISARHAMICMACIFHKG